MTVEGTYTFGLRGLYCVFEVRCLGVIMKFYEDSSYDLHAMNCWSNRGSFKCVALQSASVRTKSWSSSYFTNIIPQCHTHVHVGLIVPLYTRTYLANFACQSLPRERLILKRVVRRKLQTLSDVTCVQGFSEKDLENMIIERGTEPLILLETDDRDEKPTDVLRLQHVRPIVEVTLMRGPLSLRCVLA